MVFEIAGIQHYISIPQKCFAHVGVYFTPDGCSSIHPMRLITLYWGGIYIVVGSMLYDWVQTDLSMSEGLGIMVFLRTFSLLWKLSVILAKRESLQNFLKTLWRFSCTVSPAELEILVEINRSEHIRAKAHYTFCWTIIVILFLNCTFLNIRSVLSHGKWTKQLMLDSELFTDVQNLWVFSFNMLIQVIIAYLDTELAAAQDSIFTGSCHNLVGLLRILEHRLHHIGERGEPSSVKHCIRYYHFILDIINEFQDIFRLVLFVEFTISSLQIGLSTFHALNSPYLFDSVSALALCATISVQLLFYCFGAQTLQDKTDDISTSMYGSVDWQQWPHESKKLILLGMARAQRPFKMSGIFFVVNMVLYQSIIRTAGSFVTAFKSL